MIGPCIIERPLIVTPDFRGWWLGVTGASLADEEVARLHVTVLYSTAGRFVHPEALTNTVRASGGERYLNILGWRSNYMTLRFSCSELDQRHQECLSRGAKQNDYKLHVTLWKGARSVHSVEPYLGDLLFGPETVKTPKRFRKDR